LALAALSGLVGLGLAACGEPRATSGTAPAVGAGTSSPASGAAGSIGQPADPLAFTPAERGGQVIIGLDQEPDSLYRWGSDMLAASHVQNALYDGPIEQMNYDYQPVILDRLPTLENGGATIEPVTVQPGEAYVDPETLRLTTASRPKDAPDLPRLTVTFTLVSDLAWEDGTALTAEDSVFAQALACDPSTPASKDLCERTASYAAVDTRTVRWQGVPGYTDRAYSTRFYPPLPRHQPGQGGTPMAEMPADAILADPVFTRRPLAYGPFKLSEWVEGERIVLRRNERYWRAGEGLPFLDLVEYRFFPEPDALLEALIAGEIDVALGLGSEQAEALAAAEKGGQVRSHALEGAAWEHLDFNLDPLDAPGRVPLGACRELRQAIAYGTDREEMAESLREDRDAVLPTFLPREHWAFPPEGLLREYDYDPEQAGELLDGLGFVDHDTNPNTPRRAAKAITCTILTEAGGTTKAQVIPEGTELVLTLNTTAGSALREQSALLFQANMQRIGVGVNLAYAPAGELLAKGPDGVLASRRFDLGQLASPVGTAPPVTQFRCSELPGPANAWSGRNHSAWCNPAFDKASWQADTSLERAEALPLYHEAQRLFAEGLPALPLFARTRLSGTQADLVNFSPNPSIASETWNIEAWAYDH